MLMLKLMLPAALAWSAHAGRSLCQPKHNELGRRERVGGGGHLWVGGGHADRGVGLVWDLALRLNPKPISQAMWSPRI